MSDFVTKSVRIDSTDEKALLACGIKDVDVAVVAMGEDIESGAEYTLAEIEAKGECLGRTISELSLS